MLGAALCLFIALQLGWSDYPWNSSRVIGLLVGLVLLIFAFGIGQWQLEDRATIPPKILKQRIVLYGLLALFLISMSSNIVKHNTSLSLLLKRTNPNNRNYTTSRSTFRLLKE